MQQFSRFFFTKNENENKSDLQSNYQLELTPLLTIFYIFTDIQFSDILWSLLIKYIYVCALTGVCTHGS